MRVLKLSAKWCPPCKQYAPVFEQFAEKNPGIVFSVDVDDDKWVTAQLFGVKQIPTTVFIKDDGTYEKVSGVKSLTFLNEKLHGKEEVSPTKGT